MLNWILKKLGLEKSSDAKGKAAYWKERASDLEVIVNIQDELSQFKELELLQANAEREEAERDARLSAAHARLVEEVAKEDKEAKETAEVDAAEIADIRAELNSLKAKFQAGLAADRANRLKSNPDGGN